MGDSKTKMPPARPEAWQKFARQKAKTPGPCSLGRGVVFYEGECIPLSTFLSREIFNFFYFFLNLFLFRSIVPQFPGQFHLARPPWPRQGPTQVEEEPCRII